MVEIGVERLCCRKLEYGSILLRKAPLTLNTLILCFSEPLFANAEVSIDPLSDCHGRKTHVAKIGACSCTLKLLKISRVALIVLKGAVIRISHSLISPFRLPLTSSRRPPRCMWTLVIHCLCSFHTCTMALTGLSRWSYTRTAPSPKPATKTLPATWSNVKDVTHDPERAGIS